MVCAPVERGNPAIELPAARSMASLVTKPSTCPSLSCVSVSVSMVCAPVERGRPAIELPAARSMASLVTKASTCASPSCVSRSGAQSQAPSRTLNLATKPSAQGRSMSVSLSPSRRSPGTSVMANHGRLVVRSSVLASGAPPSLLPTARSMTPLLMKASTSASLSRRSSSHCHWPVGLSHVTSWPSVQLSRPSVSGPLGAEQTHRPVLSW